MKYSAPGVLSFLYLGVQPMFSWDNPDDRVAIVQMNSELQHAQLELLSAHCATHQLRLRFTTDDLARFGQRDILRKSIRSAASLNEYYASIEKKVMEAEPAVTRTQFSESSIADTVSRVSIYLREQRDHYFPSAVPLTNRQKAIMWPYFSQGLLDRVRVFELNGERVPNPPFYEEARALGFVNLPEVTHMRSLTFLDVIVFNEKLTERSLFHGLVHVVQFDVLGVDRYCELFVRGFVNTKLHVSVPLEAHAFSLESKFAGSPAERFSVEERVRLWVRQGRY
jgi:hypothetical protein